jgi:hypothetical protein
MLFTRLDLVRLATALAVAVPLFVIQGSAVAKPPSPFAPKASVVCDGVNVTTVTGTVGNVDVPELATCTITAATIQGNLGIEGTATVDNTTVSGSMSVGDTLLENDGNATITNTTVARNFVAYPTSTVDFSGRGDTINWNAECDPVGVARGSNPTVLVQHHGTYDGSCANRFP